MSIWYPRLRLNLLPAMLGYALLGALVAGAYGALHDQVTYSISPEYFTRLKFPQFHYADFGLPPRFFVAEIGFLATCWVGGIAGWFLARVAVPASSPKEARRGILQAFALMLACGFGAALAGFVWGLRLGPDSDLPAWQEFVAARGVVDLPNFVRVAYVHNASYMGAVLGLIIALVHLCRRTGNQGPFLLAIDAREPTAVFRQPSKVQRISSRESSRSGPGGCDRLGS